MKKYTIGGKWLDDLNTDLLGSDRACAVLAGAVLDDRLKTLLQKYLLPPPNGKEDRLLGRSGPLESFASRIELARRLNLVTDEIRKSLDWIRDIRNDAAHKPDFSFGADNVKNLVDNILLSMNLKERVPSLLRQMPYDSPKGQFVVGITILVSCMDIEIGETGQTTHVPTNALANASFTDDMHKSQ